MEAHAHGGFTEESRLNDAHRQLADPLHIANITSLRGKRVGIIRFQYGQSQCCH